MAAPPSGGDERGADQRIAKLLLDEASRVRLSPQVENERRTALYDLIEENHFAPEGDFRGPFVVRLGISGERLTFRVFNEADILLTRFTLAIGSLRRIVKDYFLICDSYFNAIKTLPPSRIEAIDMGRRGLHNEGAQVLRERLAGKVDIDEATARRLFTLICVLHIRA